jgi:hypothetical protein
MHHSIDARGVTIQFDAKPPETVRACLKRHGFRWNPRAGCWWRRRVNGAADALAAIEKLTAPRKPDGPCWKCGNPEGYFRGRGAATPVLCATCDRESQSPESQLLKGSCPLRVRTVSPSPKTTEV